MGASTFNTQTCQLDELVTDAKVLVTIAANSHSLFRFVTEAWQKTFYGNLLYLKRGNLHLSPNVRNY